MKKLSSRVPKNVLITTPPRVHSQILLMLATVFSAVLMGLAVYAAFNGKEGLLSDVLKFIQYGIVTVLMIIGGKAARDFLMGGRQ